jgi:glutamate-1-semialdehyde 2,1-aminomutase
LATAAGLAVLGAVGPADYEGLSARVAVFAKELESAIASGGLSVATPVVGPLVGLFLAPASDGPLVPPTDYVTSRAVAGNGVYPRFFHAMLRRGVALAPGPYEVLFPGLAHDDAVLGRVVEAAAAAAAELASS